MASQSEDKEADVILIGAGIMSATLGMFLNQLQPDWKIKIFERLGEVSQESSAAWNNAGTGHAGYCEMNYTPEKDGKIDTTKAFKVSEQFELSKEFWTYLLEKNILKNTDFIHKCPHHAIVFGEDEVKFLRKRYEAMHSNPMYAMMEYSEDHAKLAEWFPLIMKDRNPNEAVAATRMPIGTDINYGALTTSLINYFDQNENVSLYTNSDVQDIQRDGKGWKVIVKNLKSGATSTYKAKFVFIGAGGHALPLLNKSGIPEGKGYGGFPVGGQWLRCTNPDVINQHHVKVYGKAKVGAPPMSVPHLDARVIDGKNELLFGPFAGFSTKFLKNGSLWDLPKSVNFSNIIPMIQVGISNFSLVKYLVQQVLLKQNQRVDQLKEFYPDAKYEDWKLEIAGQRVQIIKKNAQGKGILQFGTEVITSADGSLGALLGASPGASTAVPIMLELLGKCFSEKMNNDWKEKMKEMIPTIGVKLNEHPELLEESRARTTAALKIG